MRAVVRVPLFALLGGLPTAQLQAQGTWVPPQPPCELPAAPSKISNGMQALRNAVEKPEQRDQQLAQARKLLTDAIVQDKATGLFARHDDGDLAEARRGDWLARQRAE